MIERTRSAGASKCMIVTFYSWKGGVGRTMALANVGVQLARQGRRVLMLDWDLEAPGLERYFFSDDVLKRQDVGKTPASDESGLLGMLVSASERGDGYFDPASTTTRVIEIRVPSLSPAPGLRVPPKPGPLHLLPSGHNSPAYAARLAQFSWPLFFSERKGGFWLEEMRRYWGTVYDFVLINSRTGLTDSGGVCTIQMPDMMVLVFTANDQSIRDGLDVIAVAQKSRAGFAFERAPLTVVPLLSRWEGDKEVDLGETWKSRMETTLAPLTDAWLPVEYTARHLIERLRVPHVARFAFGEPLPVLTHSLTDISLPGFAYDSLARLLASRLADVGQIIDPNYAARQPAGSSVWEAPATGPTASSRPDVVRHAVFASASSSGPTARHIMGLPLAAVIGGIVFGVILAWILWQSPKPQQQASLPVSPPTAEPPVFQPRDTEPASPQPATPSPPASRDQPGTARPPVGTAAVTPGPLQAPVNDDANRQRIVATTDDRIGDTLLAQGDVPGALDAYRKSLDIRRRAVAAEPDSVAGQRDVAISLANVGAALAASGDLRGALADYRAYMQIIQRLANTDPTNIGTQRDLSSGYDRIGGVLLAQGDLSGALSAYRESLDISERLAASDPGNSSVQHDLSNIYNRIGDVLKAQGNLPRALDAYRQGKAIAEASGPAARAKAQ